jgi:hypothetical protein
MAKQSRQNRQNRQTRRNRGGSFPLAALGKAASDILVPASLFYALKNRQQKSLKKMYRGRDR